MLRPHVGVGLYRVLRGVVPRLIRLSKAKPVLPCQVCGPLCVALCNRAVDVPVFRLLQEGTQSLAAAA